MPEKQNENCLCRCLLFILIRMELESETKRRSAIAYILRRRKRRSKTRANSGEIVRSWAEYRSVKFKPSGSQGFWTRIALLFLFPLAVVAPVIIAFLSKSHFELQAREMSSLELGVVVVISVLIIISALIFAAVIVRTFGKLIRNSFMKL